MEFRFAKLRKLKCLYVYNVWSFAKGKTPTPIKKALKGLFLLATSPGGIALHSQTSMFAHYGPRFSPGGARPVRLTSPPLGGLNRSIPHLQ